MKKFVVSKHMTTSYVLIIFWTIVHAYIVLSALYYTISPNKTEEAFLDYAPGWFVAYYWLHLIAISILLCVSIYLMKKLILTIQSQGILIKNIARYIRMLMLVFAGAYSLNLIQELVIDYNHHNSFSLSFLIDISYMLFFVGIICLLINVLLEAIRLKSENDLII